MSQTSPPHSVALALIVRNEETGVREMGPKLPLAEFDQVLAIDGNSTDGTVATLESMGIPTFAQRERGLGEAMIEARQHVTTDSFIFFHPDGNEDPADLPRMAAMLRAGAEFVVASRMIAGATNEDDHKTIKLRKWANNGFALLANVLFGPGMFTAVFGGAGNKTTDVTNGFRGISTAAWDRMNLTSHDLTMDYQMVIRALKLGIPITEFPTHEGHRVCGETNFASMPTGIAELKLVWRELKMGRHTVRGPAEPPSQNMSHPEHHDAALAVGAASGAPR
jgi:glycosyltransferase involved in cell wall biosynthesis